MDSLAWPTAVILVALVFRRQIIDLLSKGLSRVKAGPFEAEWLHAEMSIPAEIRARPMPPEPDSALEATAEVSPRSAILTRYDEVLRGLAHAVVARLGEQPNEQTVGALIDVAVEHGLIDDKTRQALIGMTVMRNLAAHGPPRELDDEKASEFFAIADATEYAMKYGLTRERE